ncbi:MAG TPA: fluoride efflux transporter CrcB [Burkholderiaceae bacterium]
MIWLAIAIGATLGAWLRYGLAILMRALHSELPMGTVAANLGGGFMIGIAVAFFAHNPNLDLPQPWRALVITGFLGGLTTFSSFSAESMALLQRGEYAWAIGHTALHVLGSLACCFAGFAAYKAIA